MVLLESIPELLLKVKKFGLRRVRVAIKKDRRGIQD
jgi:hypothetical protein